MKFNAHMDATQKHIGEYKTHASHHFHSKLVHQSQPDLNELKKRKDSEGGQGQNKTEINNVVDNLVIKGQDKFKIEKKACKNYLKQKRRQSAKGA